jgi:hypothetical protein
MPDIETVGVRESIIKAIKSQIDKLAFDSNNRLAVQNPPNLDVLLSTRASESTLSSMSGKFPSAVSLSDSLSNPTATIVGAASLGFDGTYWRRVRVDTSGRLAIQNPPNLDATLSSFSNKFPSAAALSDSLSNPTTTIVGSAILGFDGSNWRRVKIDTSGSIYSYLYGRYKSGVSVYSGTVTSSGNGSDVNVSQFSVVEVEVKVTSVSGTNPTLDVYIEGKFENTGDYKVLASQTGITTTGTWFFTINPCAFRYIRARWVVGGTSPSFTFRVDAQAMA